MDISALLCAARKIALGAGGKDPKQVGLTTLSVLAIALLRAAFITLSRLVDE